MSSDTTFGAEPEQLRKLFQMGFDDADREGEAQSLARWDLFQEEPGSRIGPYRLIRVVGEGGMGIVYLAQQERPIERTVAVKLIKPGMDSKQVIARFEAERQALALLDHPNIAHVLDAGTTDAGRPYFVMEYVEGLSITEYCDQEKLAIGERLLLFLQVCEAIQHAHHKGIIHRDIKPSNILVSVEDGKAVPKVIDFGVAKALAQPLSERTFYTTDGQLVGTPAYMSPEQAGLSGLDVDTRSDVYSLGVLLYELLTGTTPFSEKDLRKAGYLEMQRIIQEDEPTRPSTKLGLSGEFLTGAAEGRGTTPEALRRLVRGDLDWIVMKALEKDRVRRYETAYGLAMDIRRHLKHEPVLARGPSTTYRMHKLLQRHRSQAIAALAILVAIGSAAVILPLWNRDRLQLAEAEGLRHRSILSEAREAFARNDLVAALEDVRSITDSQHTGPEARLLYAGILVEGSQPEEAVSVLEDLLNEKGEIAGAAHALLARIYWEGQVDTPDKLEKVSGHRQQAEELLPETAEAYYLRAMTALTIRDKLDLLDKALGIDPAHYESYRLRAFTYSASRKYEQMRDDALAMVVLRPRDPLGYSLRAVASRELGQHEDSIANYDTAIRLTPKEDPQYIELNAKRCEAFVRMGEYERVIASTQDCLQLSPDDIALHFHLFCALAALGNYGQASTLFDRVSNSDPEDISRFKDWSMQHVFDTLDGGRSWHPPEMQPKGAAFLPMLEAQRTYNHLAARARRVISDGFGARWSPDGTKLAFSAGFHGNSGVALYDMASSETDLLIVPGKDPAWSPDGRYLVFVRDRQAFPLSELAGAERENLLLDEIREEVWIMNTDGMEPRRLASGGCPSWSRDGEYVRYHSREDNVLYMMPIEDDNVQPQPILACSDLHPSVSPDGMYVAHGTHRSLKIVESASKSLVAEWSPPSDLQIWGVGDWSPTSCEVLLGVYQLVKASTGLWIYDVKKKQAAKVLDGLRESSTVSWSSDGRRLAVTVGPPYFDIWVADLDSTSSGIEALGPARDQEGHYQDMVHYYTRRIEADPGNAANYFRRARYHDYLREPNLCRADMESYATILGHKTEVSGFSFGSPTNLGPAVNTRFDEGLPLPSTDGLAFVFHRSNAQGRSEYWWTTRKTKSEPWDVAQRLVSLDPNMHLAGVTTADGLELYSARSGEYGRGDIFVRKRRTPEDRWGDPINLGPVVNSPAVEMSPAISPDGLELYFSEFARWVRPGGCGKADLWVTRRATRDDTWCEPVNLGPPVNTAYGDGRPSLSADGLILLFDSNRPGGMGSWDLYMTRRASMGAPWERPVNLGPAVNTPAAEYWPHLSADGSVLYYESDRPGGYGILDIWQVSILRPIDGSSAGP